MSIFSKFRRDVMISRLSALAASIKGVSPVVPTTLTSQSGRLRSAWTISSLFKFTARMRGWLPVWSLAFIGAIEAINVLAISVLPVKQNWSSFSSSNIQSFHRWLKIIVIVIISALQHSFSNIKFSSLSILR